MSYLDDNLEKQANIQAIFNTYMYLVQHVDVNNSTDEKPVTFRDIVIFLFTDFDTCFSFDGQGL